MEAAVEQLPEQTVVDSVKSSEVGLSVSRSQAEENLKSNGVAESDNVTLESVDLPTEKLVGNRGPDITAEPIADNSLIIKDTTVTQLEKTTLDVIESKSATADAITTPAKEDNANNITTDIDKPSETSHIITSPEPDSLSESVVNEIRIEEVVVETTNAESSNENVQFETKVVVESNDTNEIDLSENSESAHNILNEMNQNIELSEVLCSSDVTDNAENNNCSTRQEMFNKEELLDILEGNDVNCSEHQARKREISKTESEKALELLFRLKHTRKPRPMGKLAPSPKKKYKTKKVVEISNDNNIVNTLVKDWDDDIEEGDTLNDKDISIGSEQVVESTPNAIKDEKRSSIDSVTSDGQTPILNKSGDDSQPQRRLGRVIKKKVIFDPDNPDTFTKGKVHTKIREPQIDKDQPPSKKVKAEPITPRAKSKSPTSKLQWKKPSSKNSKQNKRLSEVDRLLMDEGAVNMIYQLTPEAPKGKKNMRTKAEFIKKIQSTTPETKEMKFRERKKEFKGEAEGGEPKKILSGKHRTSLSSSVKSPSVCEDFENHSADDSIIYRRHSSSSYSSTCMSPRRLSDVEASTNQNSNVLHQVNDSQLKLRDETSAPVAKDLKETPPKEIINKDDCLSIKKKLNSKLSLALNKRKKDMSLDKPLKKQVKSNDSQVKNEIGYYKNLTIKFDHRIAEICIKNTNKKLSLESIKEIVEALTYVDLRTDTSVTLLTSECGTLCSELDFSPTLNKDLEERQKAANKILESLRLLFREMGQHSKLLCVAVGSVCTGGVALALVALADVSLAAEGATFALLYDPVAPPTPGIVALITSQRQLPQALVNDLVIFGRRLSSFEAFQGGLVSRVLCNAGFSAQVQTVVSEIANQPKEALLLKKQLLGLKKPSADVFLSHLNFERELMVNYWTSEEGQQAINASIKNSQ